MKQKIAIWICGLCGWMMTLVSCVGTAPTREVHVVDSLNQMAYASRYKDLDVSEKAARRAYETARLYRSGKAEACNNLGFCAFMRMDFERAEAFHRQVYHWTKSELELLIADVGLMKIYQRTALNKEFYDCRNSAIRRMKRIAEDDALFVDKRERRRLTYARSEFFIVSAVYYYYLQQRPEALECIRQVERMAKVGDELAADTNQWLYYHYIKGSAGLCEGETPDVRRLRFFDELYAAWHTASRKGYLYFEGNGMQGLANLMASEAAYEFFQLNRGYRLRQFGLPVDSLFPMRLGERALQCFRQYNDLYQIAGAYVSIGKYLNAHGRYAEALDTLTLALECVNDHHRRYYDCRDSTDWMKAYGSRDSFYAEKSWMEQKLKTVPEWISRIREQLSVTFAGMGMKEYSDYNRNIYLDILEDTRQDKELESRYAALEREARQLNLLLGMVVCGIVAVSFFFWIFNRRSKKRNRIHLERMQEMLDICQLITASIPAEAETEEEIVDAIWQTAGTKIRKLFALPDIRIENRHLILPDKAGKDERAMARVIDPYIRWTLENGMTSVSLGVERKKLEEQRYIHEQHIDISKRKNIVKKACLSIVNGIHPYIDRIVNEVSKLRRGGLSQPLVKQDKFEYIDELVTAIVEHNDILALWVKVRQGSLSLNIETFELEQLFVLLRKGNRAFEMKHQHLTVEPTAACVKADRALTLFMINTLAENARKYTQPGGTVRIYAQAGEDYVEVSVEDNGPGLSAGDVAHIVGEKVYDSRLIGMKDTSQPEVLRQRKGSGFGLMNCRGIIEKYRKTNPLFRVCLFGVDSALGKGSRFFFRLPQGIRKTALGLSFLVGLLAAASCASRPDISQASIAPDSLNVWEQPGYEQLLDSASDYANAAYYCNVDGDYAWALVYIDSAMTCLNAHYARFAASPSRLMTLTGQGEPAELAWWNEYFYSDFHVILDIRNEAAVAFLALKQWQDYDYNNTAYTALYKLLGEDQSLEEYCRQLERSTTNKLVGMLLAIGLFLFLLLGCYFLYFRKRLVNRWKLEQVFEVNSRIFSASLLPVADAEQMLKQEENVWQKIPQQMVDEAFDAIDGLVSTERFCLAVFNETAHRLEYASAPAGDSEDDGEVQVLMERCFSSRACFTEADCQCFPLLLEAGGESRCVGVFCLKRREGAEQPADRLLLELVARYVAVVVFQSVVRLVGQYQDIETAKDEAQRASWEDSVLHVQNQVLDNCLSTIKHETVYYPNKIKLLIARLRSGKLNEQEETETVTAISELIDYYKGIYTILSQCAGRQLEDVTFRRTAIPVGRLMQAAARYFRKVSKGTDGSVRLEVKEAAGFVLGDFSLLRFLLECLIDEALSVSLPGKLRLEARMEEEWVRFLFTDTRRSPGQDELDRLFYPDLSRMAVDARGRLRGTEFLLCKQVIREHDEYSGRRGCRINALAEPAGGYTVFFTLPRAVRPPDGEGEIGEPSK